MAVKLAKIDARDLLTNIRYLMLLATGNKTLKQTLSDMYDQLQTAYDDPDEPLVIMVESRDREGELADHLLTITYRE